MLTALHLKLRFIEDGHGVFGEMSDHCFRFEEQGRGSLYLHPLLWLRNDNTKREDCYSRKNGSTSAGSDDNTDPEYRSVAVTLVGLNLGWAWI